MLPVSLANIFVTGVVWLLVDMAPPAVTSAFQLLGDLSMAFVAASVTYGLFAAVSGLLSSRPKDSRVIGNSAELVQRIGKTPMGPMQA
jgi:hypothetical protein